MNNRSDSDHQRLKIQRTVKYLLVVLAVASLFAVSIMVHLPSKENSAKTNNQLQKTMTEIITSGQCAFVLPDLTCTQLDLPSETDILLNALDELFKQNVTSVSIILNGVKFEDNQVKTGWLQVKPSQPDITALTIDSPLLTEIGDNSFANFDKLQRFYLVNTKVSNLSRSAFKGLHEVFDFELKKNQVLKSVEFGLLQEFPRLSTFMLEGIDLSDNNSSASFFHELTGDKDISTVQIFQMQAIIMNTFRKTFIEHFPNVVSLYLSGNTISDFEPTAFSRSKNLRQIYLKMNQITTFPEETFADVIQNVKGNFYTSGNPIQCNCNLQWLQNVIPLYNESDITNFTCDSPEEFYGKLLRQVDLKCGETTESTTIVTESTTTVTESTTIVTESTTMTEPPTTPVEIECEGMNNIKSPRITISNTQTTPSFTIKEVGDALIEINYKEQPMAIVYFCHECENTKCLRLSGEKKELPVPDLKPSTEYLFCLFGEKEVETGNLNFHDCLAYKTLPVASLQTWLTNGQKSLSFTYLSLGSLVIFFVGGTVTFYIIRRKPTLLRGSGRVEVVKSRDGDLVLVMPENTIPPATPSSVYDSISGYISLGSPYGSGKGSPPPLPPYPPNWMRRNMDEHEYLEPTRFLCGRYPRNMDLLLEYEWYTSQQYRPESRG